MRNVMIVTREDLISSKKLTKVKDVVCSHLQCPASKYDMPDIIIFNCTLTEQSKVIKNRYGAMTEAINTSSPEGENMLLSFIIGNI